MALAAIYLAWVLHAVRSALKIEAGQIALQVGMPTPTCEQRTLAERFPRFSPAVAHHMAEHGSRTTAGGREWKFDPLHQTSGPNPFSRARAHLFWRRVACPVLYIEGADSPLRLQPDDVDKISRAFQGLPPE